MPQTINHPTLGEIEFPDGMGDEQIVAAIKQLEAQPQEQPEQVQPPAQERPPSAEEAIAAQQMPWGQEVSPNSVRYIGPMAAGYAMAPATRGMSIPAAAGVEAIAGALSTPASEFLAQLIEKQSGEREGMDKRAIKEAALLGSTPFVQGGGFALRALFNVGSSILTGELNQAINRKDDPERSAMERWGTQAVVPIGLSFLGARGAQLAEANVRKNFTEANRRGGTMLVSELFKEFSDMEKKQIERGNPIALKLLENMDIGLPDVVRKAYPEIPETSGLASKLYENFGLLRKLRSEVDTAQNAALKAQEDYRQMLATNPAQAKELSARANKFALDATTKKLLEDGTKERLLGGVLPDITSTASGIRNGLLQETVANAKKVVNDGLSKLYEIADIGENDIVVSKDAIERQLSKMAGKGQPLEGNVARAQARNFINQTFGDSQYLSKERYLGMKDEIAAQLAKDGYDPAKANRIAGGVYDVVSQAADTFMGDRNPAKLQAWKAAQAMARKNFVARSAGAIDLIENGKADQVYDLIRREGSKGKVFTELEEYASLLKEAGSEEAANVFRKTLNTSIRDSILDKATEVGKASGFDREWRVLDSQKLVSELEYLNRQGFPVESLGLGKASDINKLARLAARQGNATYTVDDLRRIISDASDLGMDGAAAKHFYYKAVRDNAIATGKARGNAMARVVKTSRDKNLTFQAAQKAEQEAMRDPLVVLMNDTNLKLSKDVANNRQWVMKLVNDVEPTLAKSFMDALETSGRSGEANKIRVAAIAEFANQFETVGTEQRLDIGKLYDQFYSQGGKAKKSVESLKAIVGDKAFRNFQINVLNPVKTIFEARAGVSDKGVLGSTFAKAARFAAPPVGGLRAYTSLQQIADLKDRAQYYTLYKLYLDPKTAPEFALAGYQIDKFVASNPTNALSLRLAAQDDAGDQRQ